MPHGLTVDSNDQLWLTDVGSHQVFKLAPFGANSTQLKVPFRWNDDNVENEDDGSDKPRDVGQCIQRIWLARQVLLQLGKQLRPGSGDYEFCQPSSVAVLPNGDFFVADGYCNSRIVRFNKDGVKMYQFGDDLGSSQGNRLAIDFQLPSNEIQAWKMKHWWFWLDLNTSELNAY